ncbi:hypothetical protein GCM10009104_10290 [Marinobacterium maritimum]|uniref:KfrA N-terminal DNA-binding domain-containing protein n=1 Tax=Marinobacterium maritimum TaxID=500162 RepID=A0ABN1I4E4_9GAMM
MDLQRRTEIFTVADQCLTSGEVPSSERLIAQMPDVAPAHLEQVLGEWWQQLPVRVRLQEMPGSAVPEVPESMQHLFARVWRQAMDEASRLHQQQAQESAPDTAEQQRVCDDALKRSRDEIVELEQRYREQSFKLDQAQERQTALEGELHQLKQDRASEVTELQKEKQLRVNAQQDLEQLRKTYEDAQRVFDQRVRDEQLHNLEALAKAEVDTRHYRNALDKLRDESGRKEADLAREANELRNRLSRSEAKVETLSSQVRAQEEALRELQSQDAQQQREQAQISAQLLSANNRNKRSEEQLRQLEDRLQGLNQKQAETSSDSARREAQLRTQLQQREDEVQKVQAKAQAYEMRVEALEEEIRRLKQRG